MTERFEMKNPNDWGYPITDNETGKVYNCDSNIWMKELVKEINKLNDEKNRYYEENIRIKQVVTEAFNRERTQIGSNVIKQILEQI